MTTPADYILHHYDTSPYSEKVRLLFGLKGLAWRSVIQPTIMPKPDLTPLTGGYRRIPVLQIGADVFCDTQVILAEIERRSPSARPDAPLASAINFWADRLFFGVTVPIIFGEIGDTVPKAFIEDREKLSERAFDVQAMKAAAGPMQQQWKTHAGWIERSLAERGTAFLGGETADLSDIAAYMNVWFLCTFTPAIGDKLLTGLNNVQAWRGRVAAIGHGARSELTPAEALAAARDSQPQATVAHDPDDPLGLAPGASVKVMADDYGREPITGSLVAANRDRVVISRQDPALGSLQLHFPRVGFVVASNP